MAVILVALGTTIGEARGGELLAGAAKVEITDRDAGPVNDPLFARALVLRSGSTTVAIVTVDAVAIGEIGHIKNDYLEKVRSKLNADLGLPREHVLVNASHCHGVVCKDVDERTVQAVKLAVQRLVPATVGTGVGHEDRIMENRRIKLKSGREADVRHAYSLPPDEQIVGIGPVDPEIGVLKVEKRSGGTLAVVYNFACHPIQGVPSGGNTADLTGFASKVIEDNLTPGTVALFVQGCAGDINPAHYKDFDHPRDAQPLGNLLGLSTLKAVRAIACKEDDRLKLKSTVIDLPRGDRTEPIRALEAEQRQLLGSLTGTTLNLKNFLALNAKYQGAGSTPSDPAYHYMREKLVGRNDMSKLDEINLANMKQFRANVLIMEELTRVQTNLALLKKHQNSFVAAGKPTLQVEIAALRVGDFVLTTFPGELTVQIGLGIKKRSPHPRTFVAGYTNGYIYYAPTDEQLGNVGHAQEDSDCLLAPGWQKIYEAQAQELLKSL